MSAPCCNACAADTGKKPLPLFPLFIGSSLLLSLGLGVSTGTVALWRMAFAAGTVLSTHLQLHAHVQILGFAGLFVMGVALHALPRILGGTPPSQRTVIAVLAGLGGGVLLRAIGQPLAPWAAGRLLSLLSGALELAGTFAFAAYVLRLTAAAVRHRDPLGCHIAAGTLWAVVAVLLSAGQSVYLAGHVEGVLPAALVEPFYAAALFGFLLSFIYGFASRMVPKLLGFTPPRPVAAQATLLLQAVGVAALAASSLPPLAPDVVRLLGLWGALLIAASALVFLGSARYLAGRGLALRLPFFALGLFALLFGGAAAFELSTGRIAHKFIWDGARHLYTIGFLTLLILAMSARVVPAFTGKTLARPRTMQLALALVAAGAGLRLLQIPVAWGWGGLPLYRAVGTMGLLVAVGLVLFTWVLVATFRHRTKAPATVPTPPLRLPVRLPG